MWKVHVPAGRWMSGVHTFMTKVLAEDFMNRYNRVAGPVVFVRQAGLNKFLGSIPKND